MGLTRHQARATTASSTGHHADNGIGPDNEVHHAHHSEEMRVDSEGTVGTVGAAPYRATRHWSRLARVRSVGKLSVAPPPRSIFAPLGSEESKT